MCSYCIRASCPCIYPISVRRPEATSLPNLTPGSSLLLPVSVKVDGSGPTFDLLDLTLMNHFTAVTSLIMFSGEKQHHLWQRNIPFEARSHPLLMHGLLSVAALHLAQSEPHDAMYRLRALHHHDLGLQLFNKQLSNVTPENSQTLFAFGIMLVVWVYASPTASKQDLQLHEILDLLELVRGCKAIFMLHMDNIVGTPIGSITEFTPKLGSVKSMRFLSPAASRIFENLRLRVPDSIYDHAIVRLENVFMKSIAEPDDNRTVAAWPSIVDDAFWTRLRRHEPQAMFLFTHYSILVERYENHWWWITGWSGRILQAVGSALGDAEKLFFGWDVFSSHLADHSEELRSQVAGAG